MTDKKQLNNNELEQVSGGTYEEYINVVYNTFPHGPLIDKYDVGLYKGKKVILNDHNRGLVWVMGIVIDSYERTVGCGTERTQVVNVTNASGIAHNMGATIGKEYKVCGDYYDCYELYE